MPSDLMLKGAAAERKAILTKLRRRHRECGDSFVEEELEGLIEWVLARDARYNKRKGGLGR